MQRVYIVSPRKSHRACTLNIVGNLHQNDSERNGHSSAPAQQCRSSEQAERQHVNSLHLQFINHSNRHQQQEDGGSHGQIHSNLNVPRSNVCSLLSNALKYLPITLNERQQRTMLIRLQGERESGRDATVSKCGSNQNNGHKQPRRNPDTVRDHGHRKVTDKCNPQRVGGIPFAIGLVVEQSADDALPRWLQQTRHRIVLQHKASLIALGCSAMSADIDH